MPGFWRNDKDGHTVHINGDPNMPEETVQALLAVMKEFRQQEMRSRKAFEQLWDQVATESKKVMDKELAWWWFEAGVDWGGRRHEQS